MGAITLPYTVNNTELHESWGTTEQRLRRQAREDNEDGLARFDDALAYAFAHSSAVLWAYLEADMDEVLFEMELEVRS